jgi:hypothetical protein
MNAEQNHDIIATSKSFENVVNFIYLGMTNKSKCYKCKKYEWLIMDIFCYNSVNILSSVNDS